jgi:hypothetical protein
MRSKVDRIENNVYSDLSVMELCSLFSVLCGLTAGLLACEASRGLGSCGSDSGDDGLERALLNACYTGSMDRATNSDGERGVKLLSVERYKTRSQGAAREE